ncbi:MAG: VOC family protein [Myxococcota bacterium]|nr:VOC family protein [Myxococcota bacterium]
MRLRQVALVAEDLAARVDELRSVLALGEPFQDPGVEVFGLDNAVMPVGDTFLEVVSPIREATSAGRFLERNGGDGGYMVIFQVPELAPARERAEAAGARVVWELGLDDMATVHLHPRDLGGAIVSIDWADPPESWRWAGPGWRERERGEGVSGILGVELADPQPEARARRWSEVLGVAAGRHGDAWRLSLDEGFVDFVAGEGEPHVRALSLAAPGRDDILSRARERGLLDDEGRLQLCGVTIELR